MVRFPQLALTVVVALVAVGLIRDHVRVANSQIAVLFDRPCPPPPVLLPALAPIAVAFAVESAAVGSAGPAPVFAVAVGMSACLDGGSHGSLVRATVGVQSVP